MQTLTAAFLRESDRRDCPVLDSEPYTAYRELLHRSSDFSLQIRDWMDKRDLDDQVSWLKSGIAAGKNLFQPWSMEILYVVAVLETARFSQLEAMLGIGSKTLSARLSTLRTAGFLERIVHDETPVRIEYRLTKSGRGTAAIASLLYTHLNLMQRTSDERPAQRADQ